MSADARVPLCGHHARRTRWRAAPTSRFAASAPSRCGPARPATPERRAGRGSTGCGAGLHAVEAPAHPGGPGLRRARGGRALRGHRRAIGFGLRHATVVKPAYPLWPHSVRPLRRLAGGCAPSDPQHRQGRVNEPWTRRVGEGSRQRTGACRMARQGALRWLDAVESGAPVGRPGAHLDHRACRGRPRAHSKSWRASATTSTRSPGPGEARSTFASAPSPPETARRGGDTPAVCGHVPPNGVFRGRHAGAADFGGALRPMLTGDGVRGAASRVVPLTPQRRGKPGVQGGRSVPLARPQCSTLRRLAHLAHLAPAPHLLPERVGPALLVLMVRAWQIALLALAPGWGVEAQFGRQGSGRWTTQG